MKAVNHLTIYSRQYPVYFEFSLEQLNSKGEATVSVSAMKTIEEQREEDGQWDPYIFYGRYLCKGGRLDEGSLIFANETNFTKMVRNWYRAHMQRLSSCNRYNNYY